MSVVLLDMTGHLTLQDAMKHFGVSEKTIRRWIQSGKLEAEKVDGRWQVYIEESVDQTTGHIDPSNARTTGRNDQTPTFERLLGEKDARIQQLEEQLGRKDEQIDHAQQLLAVSQKSIQQLTQQNQFLLEDKRKPLWRRLFRR